MDLQGRLDLRCHAEPLRNRNSWASSTPTAPAGRPPVCQPATLNDGSSDGRTECTIPQACCRPIGALLKALLAADVSYGALHASCGTSAPEKPMRTLSDKGHVWATQYRVFGRGIFVDAGALLDRDTCNLHHRAGRASASVCHYSLDPRLA